LFKIPATAKIVESYLQLESLGHFKKNLNDEKIKAMLNCKFSIA